VATGGARDKDGLAGAERRAAPPAEASQSPATVIGRLADEVLPMLIARLDSSSLGELEVRGDGWRVRLRRGNNGDEAGHPSAAVHRRSPGQDRAPSTERATPAAVEHGHSAAARPQSLRAERGRRQITSPAVGYYLPRAGLAPGTQVRAGDVIGHVDVLGVRQDVVAPEDGVLVGLAAEAGEAVEYGQVLARLEPGRSETPVDAGRRGDGAAAEAATPLARERAPAGAAD